MVKGDKHVNNIGKSYIIKVLEGGCGKMLLNTFF